MAIIKYKDKSGEWKELTVLKGDSGVAPIINKNTNTWLVWDDVEGAYIDSGVVAGVGTQDFVSSTYWVFNEITSGKKVIAKALTDRRYPTNNDESFVDMAQKITDMSYEEGWFAKIGYTEENASTLQDAVDYSYELAKGWNNDGSTPNLFKGDTNIKFAPAVDTSKCTSISFNGCTSLQFLPKFDFSNITSISYAFQNTAIVSIDHIEFAKPVNCIYAFSNCSNLKKVGKITPANSNISYMFNSCSKLQRIEELDYSLINTYTETFRGCSALQFIKLTNLGKASSSYNFIQLTYWGTGGEENRQSLIDSLITYSYDRASNGMSTATIQLSANTKALLTEEEIAQITNKGFTIS